ncbi:ComF family protein [Streptosporangium sandarakinum]|uniref:ComF family protein n=1 Tax=Streptosporangium sandarakinum TaxID=1260955 RepID=UPI003720B45C
MKAGTLENCIWQLKDGAYGWGMIFARIVLGHLYANPNLVRQVNAIIPMPAYRTPGEPRQGNDHAGYVIERAMEEDDQALPFVLDPPLIIKASATKRMRDTSSAAERQAVAQQLYASLQVPDPVRVSGQSIMVYDDVFTGGHTLNAVAKRLKVNGANKVYGLTLARAQWR